MRRRRTVQACAGALALAAIAIGGCGDDGGGDGGDSGSEPKPLAIEETEPSQGRFAIEAPSSVEAGAYEISFKNAGRADHEAQLIRIEGEQTLPQTLRALQAVAQGDPIPAWIIPAGGVGTTKPGQTGTVEQVLEPGRYAILDLSSGEGEGERPPAATRGAAAELEVTGEASDATLPSTEATISASEYTFKASGLLAGENAVTFENTGRQPHHIVAAPLTPGSTIADVNRAIREQEGSSGPPPFDEERAQTTSVLDGDQRQIVNLDLDPGKYALICFISNRQGGPPHALMGMVTEVDIK